MYSTTLVIICLCPLWFWDNITGQGIASNKKSTLLSSAAKIQGLRAISTSLCTKKNSLWSGVDTWGTTVSTAFGPELAPMTWRPKTCAEGVEDLLSQLRYCNPEPNAPKARANSDRQHRKFERRYKFKNLRCRKAQRGAFLDAGKLVLWRSILEPWGEVCTACLSVIPHFTAWRTQLRVILYFNSEKFSSVLKTFPLVLRLFGISSRFCS